MIKNDFLIINQEISENHFNQWQKNKKYDS